MSNSGPRAALGLAVGAALLLVSAGGAFAADTLRVAKAGTALLFTAIDIGEAAGIWSQLDLKLVGVQMDGEAPMDKAMASGDIDFALGGGNSMAFRLKGVPDVAVATLSGPPYDFALSVNYNDPIKSVAELKGKAVGVTSAGSTTDYLVHELSRIEGWGPDGMQSIGLGATRTRIAAMARGDIQAMVTTPELGYDSADHQETRVLLLFGDVVKNFLSHTILARQQLVDEHPDEVRRFLKGWFRTVAYMKDPANRAQCVKLVAQSLSISESAAGKAFGAEVQGMSDDGAFMPDAVEATRQAMVPFHVLDTTPAVKDLYDPRFTPVATN